MDTVLLPYESVQVSVERIRIRLSSLGTWVLMERTVKNDKIISL